MQLSDIQILTIELTSYCNLQCPQCSRTDEDGNIPDYVTLSHLDFDQLVSNLELEKLTNLKIVVFEGDNGDALMHPKLEKIIDTFYKLPSTPVIVIVTNGAIRSEKWWANLGEKYDSTRLGVQFSIDGLEDTHRLYRVGADYNKAISNARAFLTQGGYAIQRCLIFKHNQHQLEELHQTAKSIGFQQLILMNSDHGRFRGLTKWPVFENKIFSHFIEPSTITDQNVFERFNYIDCDFNVPVMTEVATETCVNLKKGEVHVTYRGHIIPCCVYSTDLYINNETNNGFKNLVGDVDRINLYKTKLSTIVLDTYFDKLNHMLSEKKHPGRCDKLCPDELGLERVDFYDRATELRSWIDPETGKKVIHILKE